MPRHPNDVNEFNDRDTSPTTVVIHTNGMTNGNGMDGTSKKSWSQTLITAAADGSRVKKKYKKSTLNSSNHIVVNGNGIAANGTSGNQMNSASGTVCNGNGIRKERSLHYCSICSKGFKDKYSVNVHIRTHTGEKVIFC